jgi:microcystin-dependent protein
MTAEVTMYAGSTAPDGWAFCRGQLLPISEYQKLFSLIGNTYGGDGLVTFGLPDLRSAVPMGIGQGVALPERRPKGDGRDRTMLKKGEYTDPESSRYDLGFIKLNFIIKVA